MRSEFTHKVLLALKKVPRGKVLAYKDLAFLSGYKNASRAVGNALAANSCLIEIPCHRVVCSDGALGGYKKGRAVKKRLLEKEGVVFDKRDRIPKRFFAKF